MPKRQTGLIKSFAMKPFEVDLSGERPRVMAILNVTPDSFYAQSRTFNATEIEQRVATMLAEGADWIDVGGASSRPGAEEIPWEEECRRVARALTIIRRMDPTKVVSVDTYRSEVVRRIVTEFGGVVVNDISAGGLDKEMLPTVAELKLPYIAMHMRGNPQTMQQLADYQSIVGDVITYFEQRLAELQAWGIKQVILDPGFGFAKTLAQNYTLLGALHQICALGYPVLSALSRKSMIYKPLGITPEDALIGTAALNWESLRQGARILRVHDVREAVEVCRLFEIFQQERNDKSE